RPAITRTRVDLPAPLRPISPMRPRGGSAALAPSRIVRPPRRTVMSCRLSMGGPLASRLRYPKRLRFRLLRPDRRTDSNARRLFGREQRAAGPKPRQHHAKLVGRNGEATLAAADPALR